jgi:thiamine-phosphate pyrophosphorylase
MLTCYITDRTQFPGSEAERQERLLRTIAGACSAGVDYIQLRERDLGTHELEQLATEALRIARFEGTSQLLINHRTDVAVAIGADGVHLTSHDVAPPDARAAATALGGGRFLVSVACHTLEEIRRAQAYGADFALLAPIFQKPGTPCAALGLNALRDAARPATPTEAAQEKPRTRRGFAVFALGGVDASNVASCAAAGAAGVAGIRLFQQADDLKALVRRLRDL